MDKYVRCIRNDTYFHGDMAENFAPDLIVGEVYRLLPVSTAEERRHFVRVIDHSGVGCLYPNDYFEMVSDEELLATPAAVTAHINLRDKVELRTLADRQSAQQQRTISMSHLLRQWLEERLDLATD